MKPFDAVNFLRYASLHFTKRIGINVLSLPQITDTEDPDWTLGNAYFVKTVYNFQSSVT